MAVDESLLGTEDEVVACRHVFDWFSAPEGSQLFVISEIRDGIKDGILIIYYDNDMCIAFLVPDSFPSSIVCMLISSDTVGDVMSDLTAW